MGLRIGKLCIFMMLAFAATAWAQQSAAPDAPTAKPKVAFPGAVVQPKPEAKSDAPAAEAAPPADESTYLKERKTDKPLEADDQPKPLESDQKKQDEEAASREAIHIGVNEINVVFTASDKHGEYVKYLTKDDLKVLDNGRPATIRSFYSESNLPLRVGLLIDSSNSIRSRFEFEQESAIEFLQQIIHEKKDKAFVVSFFDSVELEKDWTDDVSRLAEGVRRMKPGGGTALFDAIYQACKDRLANPPAADGPTRRAIILISDGDDNQSHVTREEALEMAERAEVIIYAISTNIMGETSPGDKILRQFAEATGGKVFFPNELKDIAIGFQQIQEELRSQYALAFKPVDLVSNGTFHTIAISAPKNKSVKIRTRRGYFAPKP